jgi:hypothetical protein
VDFVLAPFAFPVTPLVAFLALPVGFLLTSTRGTRIHEGLRVSMTGSAPRPWRYTAWPDELQVGNRDLVPYRAGDRLRLEHEGLPTFPREFRQTRIPARPTAEISVARLRGLALGVSNKPLLACEHGLFADEASLAHRDPVCR